MLNDADVIRLAGINVHAGADGDTLDLSAYAPPEPPENGNQLPTVNEHGAVLWRGDDSELADALIRHWLGPYAVATAGEVWQWQPERRGWVRITTEQLVAWLECADPRRDFDRIRSDSSRRGRGRLVDRAGAAEGWHRPVPRPRCHRRAGRRGPPTAPCRDARARPAGACVLGAPCALRRSAR